MANPSIRGHLGLIKFFRNGELAKIINITKCDINQDSSFSRAMYVGNPIPEGDQTIEGWSGSVDLEVKDATEDEFIDALINENLNGIGISDYTFMSIEKYTNGTQKSYVYFDAQFKLSRSQGGLNEKITKKLDFQASGRLPV